MDHLVHYTGRDDVSNEKKTDKREQVSSHTRTPKTQLAGSRVFGRPCSEETEIAYIKGRNKSLKSQKL